MDFTLTYDGAGNVTLDNRPRGGYSYTYDAAGRMATFSINGVLQASYRYDNLGRQVSRALTGGLTIHSVFDSAGNRIAEYNQATGALIREYIWLNGAPIAVVEGGVIYYIRTDHIGRPVFATNAAGVKVWTASYLPFGGVRTSTGTPITLRFPGQWFQSESGLHQNWMRDYEPTTGRYLQADPLGLVDGASVYGYVGGNPGRYVDPTGQYCVSINGTTTCRGNGQYKTQFPTPSSWDDNSWFGPGTKNYHFYDKSVLDPHSSFDVDCLLAGLYKGPDPLPSNGATPNGTHNYANPGGWGDGLDANPVISYAFTDPVSGFSGIVNVTMRGHGLSDGIVVRLATPRGILTYGEGNSWLQSPGSPFKDDINGVWPQMNADIMNKCACGLDPL
ncbi:MAG: RHS repeat-associated core domain-containing protein [Microgenomates group bacterium]